MTLNDLPTLILQVCLPCGLLALLALSPAGSAIGFWVQTFATGAVLLALTYVSLWLELPWWIPYGYILCFLFIATYRFRQRWPLATERLPTTRWEWVASIGLLSLGVVATALATTALVGHRQPAGYKVDLPLPLGPGTYLVAHGGSTEAVNAHMATLTPETRRQRAYRGQSFAVDLIGISALGLRAAGWRPVEPNTYVIFGTPVYAPCSGTVVAAADDLPDTPVPQRDLRRLEGNYVFLACDDFRVLLAHLKADSIRVTAGARVKQGQQIGQVGNSGNTTEPHLHVHVQQPSKTSDRLAGEPVPLTLNGRFVARNDRLRQR